MTNPDTKFRTNMQETTPIDSAFVTSGERTNNNAHVNRPQLADQARVKVGEHLHQLAQTVREHAAQDQRGDLATITAGALERGATYLQKKDIAALRADVATFIQRHPFESVLVGLGLSMLIMRGRRR